MFTKKIDEMKHEQIPMCSEPWYGWLSLAGGGTRIPVHLSTGYCVSLSSPQVYKSVLVQPRDRCGVYPVCLWLRSRSDFGKEHLEGFILMYLVQKAQVEVGVEGLCEVLLVGVEVCHVLCIVEGHQPPLVV